MSCNQKQYLQQSDGEAHVGLGSDPYTERLVHALNSGHCLQQFIHELKPQMAILQQHPASLHTDTKTHTKVNLVIRWAQLCRM